MSTTMVKDEDTFLKYYFPLLPAEVKMRIFHHANQHVWKKPNSIYKAGDIVTYKMHIKRKIIANIPRGLCKSDVQPNPLGPLIIKHYRWSRKHRCYIYNYEYGRVRHYSGEAKEYELERTTKQYMDNFGHFVMQ